MVAVMFHRHYFDAEARRRAYAGAWRAVAARQATHGIAIRFLTRSGARHYS